MDRRITNPPIFPRKGYPVFIRPFRNLRQSLLLLLASSLPLQSTFAETPTASGAPAVRKNKKSDNVGKTVVRAQSPTPVALDDQEAKDAAVFDAGMGPQQPSCTDILPWTGKCADLPSSTSSMGPNPPTDPNASSLSSSQNTNAPLSNLDAGQGASTAQNMAPAFFGDFFAPNGLGITVPGSLIPTGPGQTPFGIVMANPSGPPYNYSYVRQLNTGTGGALFNTDTSNHVWYTPAPASGLLNYQQVFGANHVPLGTYFTPAAGNSTLLPFPSGTTNPTGAPFTSISSNGGGSIYTEFASPNPTGPAGTNPVFGVNSSAIHFGNNEATQAFYGFVVPPHSDYYYLMALVQPASVNIYSPSATAGGIQKLVDNSSPIPRDRVFLNYNYFANSVVAIDGTSMNVNRLTPGFEKTFFDQRMSIEVRVPFATALNSLNLSDGTTNTSGLILGNQTTYLKSLLYSNPEFSLATGMGIQAPTAQSNSYNVNAYSYSFTPTGSTSSSSGQQSILQINNQAWHLLPYIGGVYTPNDRLWAQSVGQLDFATNANSVYGSAQLPQMTVTQSGNININSIVTPQTNLGQLRDTNFMYLSANAGYWMYKTRNQFERGITGFAPTVELDYNQSLQRSSTVQGIYGNVASPINNQSIVNGIVGATTVIGYDKYVSVAYVAPLTTGTNRVFDGELRVMCNWYFGAPRVNPRFSNVPGT